MTQRRPPYKTNQQQPPTPDPAKLRAPLHLPQWYYELTNAIQEAQADYIEAISAAVQALAVTLQKLKQSRRWARAWKETLQDYYDTRRWARAWKQAARANHDAYLDAQLLAGETQSCGHPVACIRVGDEKALGEFVHACGACEDVDAARRQERDLLDLETIAAEIHAIWSHWMTYMLSRCIQLDDDQWCIASADWERWQRQMQLPYSDLTELEQASDQSQARKIIAAIRQEPDYV